MTLLRVYEHSGTYHLPPSWTPRHSGDDASTRRLYSGASLTRLSQAPSLSQAPLSGASLRGTSLRRLSTSAFHDPAEVEDQLAQIFQL